MIVCACDVYAPRLARPMIAGAPACRSASGRSPSTEKITTRGIAGAGDGEGTTETGVGVAECPQPERRSDTHTPSGPRRARRRPLVTNCSREPKETLSSGDREGGSLTRASAAPKTELGGGEVAGAVPHAQPLARHVHLQAAELPVARGVVG